MSLSKKEGIDFGECPNEGSCSPFLDRCETGGRPTKA